MGVIKTPYEISIWELVEGENNSLEEQKIAVIGSNDMTAKCRAINPTLSQKINGETILTFQLYNRYYDELESPNKPVENPFIKYLVNERLVKLKLEKTTGIEWYDFIIDNVQENSEQKSYSYSARSLHIKELGKTGFNIEFNQTLSNNQGTIVELGRRALQGSDWVVNTDLPENGGSDILKAYQEDELVLLKVIKSGLTAKEMLGNRTINLAVNSYIMAYHSSWIDTESELNEVQFLYADNITQYYSGTSESETAFYSEITKHLDANGVFIDNDNFLISLGKEDRVNCFERSTSIPLIPGKGLKLSKQKILKYEPLLDKYVNEYVLTSEGQEAIGSEIGPTDRINAYITTETIDTTLVKNIMVNSDEFKDTGGWSGAALSAGDAGLKFSVVFNYSLSDLAAEREKISGDIKDKMTNIKQISYLKIKAFKDTTTEVDVVNTAIKSNLSYLKDVKKGQNFILKLKAWGGTYNSSESGPETSEEVINIVDSGDYKNIESCVNWEDLQINWLKDSSLNFRIKDLTTGVILCEFKKITEDIEPFNEDGYIYYEGTWKSSYSEKRMQNNNIKFMFSIPIDDAEVGQRRIFVIQDIQLFLEVYGTVVEEEDEIYRILLPGETSTTMLQTTTHYYNSSTLTNLTNKDQIAYLPSQDSYYDILYNDNFYTVNWGSELGSYIRRPYERITSIDTKESNRFNIIQQLCETFKCWADFQVEHDELGRIVSKKIAFREYIGKDNYAGFKYGINLKSIQRTIDSEQIVTKIIVKANTNEYAPNGFCTIARATENPLMDTFLLDFSYYTKQLLLDEDTLKKDLYTNWNNNNNGLYAIVRNWAVARNDLIDKQTAISTTLMHLSSDIKVLEEKISAAQEEYNEARENYYNLTRLGEAISPVEYPNVPACYDSEDNPYYHGTPLDDDDWKQIWWHEDKVVEIVTVIEKNWAIIRSDSTEQVDLSKKKEEQEYYQQEYDNYTILINNYNENILSIETAFFDKYHNFIREGSWTSSEYIDDNDYYLAAVDVARTSAKPKITYTINVIDVSPLENYTSYTFSLGDKTFIEDTEFFGWVKKFDPITDVMYNTPYHEEIVVTEMISPLDSPESNQIKVQNYKTQFEDLFQRITAATQSLQYASGDYQRAANILTESGGMRGKLLQDAIDNNSLILRNANNRHVEETENGLLLTNYSDNNKVILNSYGILLSNKLDENGNDIWSAAITGNGINADNITTGTLNAAIINITTGGGVNGKAFSWNQYGLNAYNMRNNAVFVNEFIRFDQYGIYHYHGTASGTEYKPSSIADVKALSTNNLSNFYLLRDGTLFVRGHIEAGSGTFNGKITAATGTIGSWNIGDLTTRIIGQASSRYFSNTLFSTPMDIVIDDIDYQYVTFFRGEGNSYDKAIAIARVEVTDEIKVAGQGSSIWSRNWNDNVEFIFSVDKTGKLYAQNAEVSGIINATDGSFNGTIIANNGKIGDWIISNNDKYMGNSLYGVIDYEQENEMTKVPNVILSSDGTKSPDNNGYWVLNAGEEKQEDWLFLAGRDITSESALSNAFGLGISKDGGIFASMGQIANLAITKNSLVATATTDPSVTISKINLDIQRNEIGQITNITFISKEDLDQYSHTSQRGRLFIGYRDIADRHRYNVYSDASELSSNDRTDLINFLEENTVDGLPLDFVDNVSSSSLNTMWYALNVLGVETAILRQGICFLSQDGSKVLSAFNGSFLCSPEIRIQNPDDLYNGKLTSKTIINNESNISIPYNILTITNSTEDYGKIILAAADNDNSKPRLILTNIIEEDSSSEDGYSQVSRGDLYGDWYLNEGKLYLADIVCNTNNGGLRFYYNNDLNYFGYIRSIIHPQTQGTIIYLVGSAATQNSSGTNLIGRGALALRAVNVSQDNSVDARIYISPNSSIDTLGIRITYNSSMQRGDLFGSWYLGGSAIATTSDLNKKNTINYISDIYSILFDNLIPVTYKYNDGTSNRLHIGFIAQDVEEALRKSNISTSNFAGLVIANEEDEETKEIKQVYYLRYEEFIALNTSEIQKLKRRVTVLEEELARVKSFINY